MINPITLNSTKFSIVLFFTLFACFTYVFSASPQSNPQVYTLIGDRDDQFIMVGGGGKLFSQFEGYGQMTPAYFKNNQKVWLKCVNGKVSVNAIERVSRWGRELGGVSINLEEENTCTGRPILLSNYDFPQERWRLAQPNKHEIQKIRLKFETNTQKPVLKIISLNKERFYLVFDHSIKDVYNSGGHHLLNSVFEILSTKNGNELLPLIDIDNDGFPEFYQPHSDGEGAKLIKMYPKLNTALAHVDEYWKWKRNGERKEEAPKRYLEILENPDQTYQNAINDLTNENEDVKIQAAITILKINPSYEQAENIFLEFSRSEKAETRMKALQYIQGAKVVSGNILKILKDGLGDSVSQVRYSACVAINFLKDKSPRMGLFSERLTELVNDESQTTPTRLHCMGALVGVNQNKEESVKILINILNDKDPIVRSGAASNLGDLGQLAKPAVIHLKKALMNEDFRTRKSAEIAIHKITRKSDGTKPPSKSIKKSNKPPNKKTWPRSKELKIINFVLNFFYFVFWGAVFYIINYSPYCLGPLIGSFVFYSKAFPKKWPRRKRLLVSIFSFFILLLFEGLVIFSIWGKSGFTFFDRNFF